MWQSLKMKEKLRTGHKAIKSIDKVFNEIPGALEENHIFMSTTGALLVITVLGLSNPLFAPNHISASNM